MRSARRMGRGIAAAALIGAAATARIEVADARPAGPARAIDPHDPVLFSITKSENRNEVVYSVDVDERCAPIGDAAVYAYWRMHEKGPAVIEPLLSREEAAYGIGSQRVISRREDGGSIDLVLRALPSRHILVRLQREAAGCRAWSQLPIRGTDAYLYNVYVRLKPFGVDYLLLAGWAIDGSHVVEEKIER